MMNALKTLPENLVANYQNWQKTDLKQTQPLLQDLATHGQNPLALVISCCDSRVHSTALFGALQGDFFLHRNIANLVPPYRPDGTPQGTAAAIEYAVTALKVSHIIIIGHSMCGGVKGCHDMCMGNAPALEDQDSLVGRWVDLLRPAFDRVKHIKGEAERVTQLEHAGVLMSIEHLMTYPFVKSAADNGTIALHGLWTDIATGGLEQYDPSVDKFIKV